MSLQHSISYHLSQHRLVKTQPLHVSFSFAFWKYSRPYILGPPTPTPPQLQMERYCVFWIVLYIFRLSINDFQRPNCGLKDIAYFAIIAYLHIVDRPTQLFYIWIFICVNIQIKKTQQDNLLIRILPTNDSHRPNCRQKDSLYQPLRRHHKLIWLDRLVFRAVHHL